MKIQIHVNFGPTASFETRSNIRSTPTHAKLQIHAENVLTHVIHFDPRNPRDPRNSWTRVINAV